MELPDGGGDWLAPSPPPSGPAVPDRHDEHGVDTFTRPKLDTSTWPPVGTFSWPRTCGRQAASTVAVVGPHCSTPCPRPVAVCVTTVAGEDTIWVDNNGERETTCLIGMDTPESPNASVAMSYQLYKHCPACCVQQLGQTGISSLGAGFGFMGLGPGRALGSRHPTWTGSVKPLWYLMSSPTSMRSRQREHRPRYRALKGALRSASARP
jgi:hypothetical protein